MKDSQSSQSLFFVQPDLSYRKPQSSTTLEGTYCEFSQINRSENARYFSSRRQFFGSTHTYTRKFYIFSARLRIFSDTKK